MTPANLDALLNDLDATLNELQMEDAAQKRQEQMLKHQQEQLRLQQQLIEVQTTLLKQQQMNAVSATAVPPPGMSSISPPIPYSQYSSAQAQREQLMQYSRGGMRTHSHHSEPDFLSSDVQSVMPRSTMSAPGAGAGVFGSRVGDTESVTSSEKKKALFGFGSTKSSSSTKKKEEVLATLESVGF